MTAATDPAPVNLPAPLSAAELAALLAEHSRAAEAQWALAFAQLARPWRCDEVDRIRAIDAELDSRTKLA